MDPLNEVHWWISPKTNQNALSIGCSCSIYKRKESSRRISSSLSTYSFSSVYKNLVAEIEQKTEIEQERQSWILKVNTTYSIQKTHNRWWSRLVYYTMSLRKISPPQWCLRASVTFCLPGYNDHSRNSSTTDYVTGKPNVTDSLSTQTPTDDRRHRCRKKECLKTQDRMALNRLL